MTTTLALDLGTQCGWALKTPFGITSGSYSFKTKRNEGAGMRYLRFRQWLDTMKDACIDAVYFEEVRRHIGTDAAHAYGGYMATLISWCEENLIPYSGVPVGTIKKSACDDGRASKQDMINKAIELGFNPIDDNEADAIHILRYVTN